MSGPDVALRKLAPAFAAVAFSVPPLKFSKLVAVLWEEATWLTVNVPPLSRLATVNILGRFVLSFMLRPYMALLLALLGPITLAPAVPPPMFSTACEPVPAHPNESGLPALAAPK